MLHPKYSLKNKFKTIFNLTIFHLKLFRPKQMSFARQFTVKFQELHSLLQITFQTSILQILILSLTLLQLKKFLSLLEFRRFLRLKYGISILFSKMKKLRKILTILHINNQLIIQEIIRFRIPLPILKGNKIIINHL